MALKISAVEIKMYRKKHVYCFHTLRILFVQNTNLKKNLCITDCELINIQYLYLHVLLKKQINKNDKSKKVAIIR